jgi:hypothetical protein
VPPVISNGVRPEWKNSGQRPDDLDRGVAGDDGDGDWKSTGHRSAGNSGDEGTGPVASVEAPSRDWHAPELLWAR